MTSADKRKADKSKTEELREAANKADLTSSPALKDDAETDSGGTKDQHMPDGNRLD